MLVQVTFYTAQLFVAEDYPVMVWCVAAPLTSVH